MFKPIAWVVVFMALAANAFADQGMIDVGAGGRTSEAVTMKDLMNSPAYRANREEIATRAKARVMLSTELDEGLKAMIVGEIDELPFHRIVDIEFGVGFPDVIAVCLEGHPTNPLAIEACAAITIFGGTVSANVKYRWDLVVHRTSSGLINQLSIGPGAGLRYFETRWFETKKGLMADVMGSLEYVFWISKYFGLTAQLDLGATVMLTYDNGSASNILPMGKLTIGVAF